MGSEQALSLLCGFRQCRVFLCWSNVFNLALDKQSNVFGTRSLYLIGSSYEIAAIVSLLLLSYSRQRSVDHGQEYFAADLVIHTRPCTRVIGQRRRKQQLIFEGSFLKVTKSTYFYDSRFFLNVWPEPGQQSHPELIYHKLQDFSGLL